MIITRSFLTRLTRIALFALVATTALLGSTQYVFAETAGNDGSEQLVLAVAPESLRAVSGEHEILSVQIADSTGVPILLTEPMRVRLFSSDPRVASVEPEVEIPAGSSFTIAKVLVSGKSGSVSFTASADGVSPSHSVLDITETSVESVGTTLAIFPMPERLIKGSTEPGRAMIAVLDNSGSPVISAFDVEIKITSSNEQIISVPESVIIPAGYPGVFVDVTPHEPGTGQLIAVADGYSSSGIGVDVSEPSLLPTHLVASVIPERWDHAGIGNPMLVVQALSNEDLAPSYLPCGTVFFASSNPDLLAVPNQVDVPCDTQITSIEIPLVSTSTTGYALITVATPGLVSTSTEFNAVNTAPDELRSWVLPPNPASGDNQPPQVVVQLVDHEGSPVAAVRPMPVTVRIGGNTINDVVQINTNESYSTLPYTLIANPTDPADIWISVPGVSSTPLSWSTTDLPVEATIEFSDSWRYQSEGITATVTVRVQGRLVQGALVSWEVEDGTAVVQVAETDANGQARAEIHSSALGQAQVTARITSSAIGSIEVMNHFDSVSANQDTTPEARLLGLPADLIAGIVIALVLVLIVVDIAHSIDFGFLRYIGIKRLSENGPTHSRIRRSTPDTNPKSTLLRLLAFRSGGDSLPLPELPILDRLDAEHVEFIRSEYAMRIESIEETADLERMSSQQRELIAGAAVVSALERITERQSKDNEHTQACKTAEHALNAASHLNNTRIAAGGDRLDRTRLWIIYSQTLLNTDRLQEALTAANAASKTATQIGSQELWAPTVSELENQIRLRISDTRKTA